MPTKTRPDAAPPACAEQAALDALENAIGEAESRLEELMDETDFADEDEAGRSPARVR